MIASAGIGASYAVLADRIGIDGFAECWCVVEFIDVSVDDNENDKSVADVEADIDGSGNGISASISNAHLGYS